MYKCEKCGTNLSDDCVAVWKCPECEKAFKVSFSKLYKIQEVKKQKLGQHLIKCSSCGYTLDDGNEKIACKCSSCENVLVGNLAYFAGDNDRTNKAEIDPGNSYPNMIECPECGRKILSDSKICSYCGYPLEMQTSTEGVKHKKSIIEVHKMLKRILIVAVAISVVIVLLFIIKSFPKCEHEYDDGVITNDPTCTEEGEKTFTCSLCGETIIENVPVIEHEYTTEITKYSTCKEEGEKTLICKNCGATKTEIIPNKEHSYQEEITKESSFDEEGIKTFTCKICGDTYTETIPIREDKIVVTIEDKINYEKDTSAWRFFPFVELVCKVENMTDKDIKGVEGTLNINDLFGKQIISINWDIMGEDIPAKGSITQKDYGIEINEFVDNEMKLYNTDYDDLKFEYIVKQIVYTDGTQE